jgi:hypothetical protein
MTSISHWGMFAGFWTCEDFDGRRPGIYRAVWRALAYPDMYGNW